MRRPSAFGQEPEGSPGRPWGAVVLVFLVIALAVGAWYWWTNRPEPEIPSGAYQAVFLDNGQTYFGKLSWEGSREGYVRLTEVYYLDFRQNPQDPSLNASDLKLTKLGGEVHGPEDFMDVNAQHILYTEDLRSDSKIVQAIADYTAKSNQ